MLDERVLSKCLLSAWHVVVMGTSVRRGEHSFAHSCRQDICTESPVNAWH